MRENGTDRDVALELLGMIDAIRDEVFNINANLFSVIIQVQPVDVTGTSGDTVTFHVVAANVTAYQWEFQPNEDQSWRNSSSTGNTTDTLSVSVPSGTNIYNNRFRCKLTGKDGQSVYTNVVKIIRVES